MVSTHALKTLPEFFKLVGNKKTFEARKDDRGFEIGDVLRLQEWSEEAGCTGAEIKFAISYILRGEQWGIKEGYCVLGLASTGSRPLS